MRIELKDGSSHEDFGFGQSDGQRDLGAAIEQAKKVRQCNQMLTLHNDSPHEASDASLVLLSLFAGEHLGCTKACAALVWRVPRQLVLRS